MYTYTLQENNKLSCVAIDEEVHDYIKEQSYYVLLSFKSLLTS